MDAAAMSSSLPDVTHADCEEDLRGIEALVVGEGWCPGVEVRHLLQLLPRDALLVGKNPDGRVVSSLAAVRTDAGHGWLGLYIVSPEWRGKGLGMKMWTRAMETTLAGCTTVGLDGVVSQQSNYRRSGFVHEPWETQRFSGTIQQVAEAAAAATGAETQCTIHPVSGEEDPVAAQCAAYDHAHVFPGIDRQAFMRGWLTQPDHVTAMAAVDGAGHVVGFGVLRPTVDGSSDLRVGPLYADSPELASRLLRALASQPSLQASQRLHLDVPAANVAGVSMLRDELGFTNSFSCKRMYHGVPPVEDPLRQFSLCCWEITF